MKLCDTGRWPTLSPDHGAEEATGSKGALPLTSMGALPFPLTTSTKDAAGEALER
jgi:hypothetical protein